MTPIIVAEGLERRFGELVAVDGVDLSATAQVPISAMSGWLPGVARINPMTNVLRLARAGFVPDELNPPSGFGVSWAEVWPGLTALGAIIAVLTVFALRGMRRLTP